MSQNLAITQSVISLLREHAAVQDRDSLWNAPTMFECARLVGETIRGVYRQDAEALKQFGVDFSATFILCGQIGDEPPRTGRVTSLDDDTIVIEVLETTRGRGGGLRLLRSATTLQHGGRGLLLRRTVDHRAHVQGVAQLDGQVLNEHRRAEGHVRVDVIRERGAQVDGQLDQRFALHFCVCHN